MPFSVACGNAVMPPLLCVSALVFLVMGIPFAALYWLFDGISFLCSFVLARQAVRNWRQRESVSVSGGGGDGSGGGGGGDGSGSGGGGGGDGSGNGGGTASTYRSYCTMVCCVAAASALAEVGFLVAALVLWDRQMNPMSSSNYGRDGSSFFFCSLYSSTTNLFVLRHFVLLGRTPPSTNKSTPSLA
jgi:hypothetical protein